MTLTLVSHALCPYVQRAAIALAEKAIPFRRIDIDLAAKPEWFLRLSPLGKVPLLRVESARGVTALFESQVIVEYLEDTAAPPLHPADPLERARHRAWIEMASATLAAIARFYGAPDEAVLTRERDGLAALLARIGAELGTQPGGVPGAVPGLAPAATPGAGPWFAGARFSLVDAAWAPVLRYLDAFEAIGEPDLTAGHAALAAWRATLATRPSVRNAVGADYPQRLRDFLARRGSALSRQMDACAAA